MDLFGKTKSGNNLTKDNQLATFKNTVEYKGSRRVSRHICDRLLTEKRKFSFVQAVKKISFLISPLHSALNPGLVLIVWHPVIQVKFGTCGENWDFFVTKI